jgi:hypothetical protein
MPSASNSTGLVFFDHHLDELHRAGDHDDERQQPQVRRVRQHEGVQRPRAQRRDQHHERGRQPEPQRRLQLARHAEERAQGG